MLGCYRLAKFFSVHPREFFCEPVSAISRHLVMVDRLLADVEPPPEPE